MSKHLHTLAEINKGTSNVTNENLRRYFLHGLAKHLLQPALSILAKPFTSLSNDLQDLLPIEAMYNQANEVENEDEHIDKNSTAKIAKLEHRLAKMKATENAGAKVVCTYYKKTNHTEDECYKKQRDQKEEPDANSDEDCKGCQCKKCKQKAELEECHEKVASRNTVTGGVRKARNRRMHAISVTPASEVGHEISNLELHEISTG